MTEKYIRTKDNLIFPVYSEFIDDENRKIYEVKIKTFTKGLTSACLFFVASDVETLYGIKPEDRVMYVANNDDEVDRCLKSDMRFGGYKQGIYKEGK